MRAYSRYTETGTQPPLYGDECKSWKIDVKKIKAQLEELGNQFPSQDNN